MYAVPCDFSSSVPAVLAVPAVPAVLIPAVLVIPAGTSGSSFKEHCGVSSGSIERIAHAYSTWAILAIERDLAL